MLAGCVRDEYCAASPGLRIPTVTANVPNRLLQPPR